VWRGGGEMGGRAGENFVTWLPVSSRNCMSFNRITAVNL